MIRLMEERDLSNILSLEKELFTSCWTEEHFLYELNENEYSRLYVLEENNVIIGYYGLWLIFDQAQITTIGIDKKYQGKGFSKLLMNHLIDESIAAGCEIISLEVRISNDTAINLYKKYGFETVNIRKNYYQDNHEDAYLMIKPIGGLNI